MMEGTEEEEQQQQSNSPLSSDEWPETLPASCCINLDQFTADPSGMKPQQQGRNMPLKEHARKTLLRWYNEHEQDAYPTQREKENLAKAAEITVAQV